MHTRGMSVLAAVLGVLVAACGAWGQPIAPGEPQIIVPQMPIIAPERASPVSLTAAEVEASVEGQVATTVVRLTLSNPSRRVQEAQVLMPVPRGAVVRQFVLEGMGEKGIAEILPKDEARRIYQQIVSKIRDPGLLEFVGHSAMRSSVFPVPAQGEQVVSLTYEQLLDADGDRLDYEFPRSMALADTGVTWSMSATIEADRPITAVYSPTHDLVTERKSPTEVRVSVPKGGAASGSLAISWLLESAEGVTASMIAYPDPGDPEGGYFLLLAGLPPVAPEDAEAVKREVTIVLDRSGSMRGEKMAQAREAALQILAGLDDGEAFNIVDYSDSIESFAESPVTKTDEVMAEASEYLEGLKAVGGTNIHDALLEALRPEPREGFLPMVLFLTDGLPTVGVRSESAIREAVASSNAHDRRIFTFGVGYDVNAPLLTNIAQTSRATTTFVLPEEDVEAKVGQVFRRLSGPVLARPEIAAIDRTGEPASRDVRDMLPAALPDLFEGDQLVLLGRYTPAAGQTLRLRLTGEYFGDQRQFEFGFATDEASAKNGYVPRLWAGRKISALVNEIRQAGANGHMPGEAPEMDESRMKELVDEIVRLSIRWGILTDYTAFLAVPEDELRDRLDAVAGLPSREGRAVAPAADLNRAYSRQRLVEGQRVRAGREAVRAEQKVQMGQRQANLGEALSFELELGAAFADADRTGDVRDNVRQIADQTFFKRDGRWVQAELVEAEDQSPQDTVEYGSEAYDDLLDQLAAEGRAGVVALRGDVLIVRNGRRVLVRGPGEIDS